MPVLIYSPEIAKAAKAHVDDIGRAGESVHIGGDGSTPTQRVGRQIKWKSMVAECIEVGSTIPSEIIESLIIDDGNEERSNRKVIFGRNAKYVGVACGKHETYGIITVIDFIGGIPEGEVSGQTPGVTPVEPPHKEESHYIHEETHYHQQESSHEESH